MTPKVKKKLDYLEFKETFLPKICISIFVILFIYIIYQLNDTVPNRKRTLYKGEVISNQYHNKKGGSGFVCIVQIEGRQSTVFAACNAAFQVHSKVIVEKIDNVLFDYFWVKEKL